MHDWTKVEDEYVAQPLYQVKAELFKTLLPSRPVPLADTIVPDFPLVNKSFDLSYVSNDL